MWDVVLILLVLVIFLAFKSKYKNSYGKNKKQSLQEKPKFSPPPRPAIRPKPQPIAKKKPAKPKKPKAKVTKETKAKKAKPSEVKFSSLFAPPPASGHKVVGFSDFFKSTTVQYEDEVEEDPFDLEHFYPEKEKKVEPVLDPPFPPPPPASEEVKAEDPGEKINKELLEVENLFHKVKYLTLKGYEEQWIFKSVFKDQESYNNVNLIAAYHEWEDKGRNLYEIFAIPPKES